METIAIMETITMPVKFKIGQKVYVFLGFEEDKKDKKWEDSMPTLRCYEIKEIHFIYNGKDMETRYLLDNNIRREVCNIFATKEEALEYARERVTEYYNR